MKSMSYTEREDIFNSLITSLRDKLYEILKLDKHKNYKKDMDNEGYVPVLSVNPETKYYRFNCYCFECPANAKGLCSTKFQKIPTETLHEFDGDNIIKNYCG